MSAEALRVLRRTADALPAQLANRIRLAADSLEREREELLREAEQAACRCGDRYACGECGRR